MNSEVRLWRFTAAVVSLSMAFGTAVLAAAPAAKQPWEWTIEERLAMRLDPAKIAARQDLEVARSRAAGGQPKPEAREEPQNYSIDGSRNPELLLPHELFDGLLTGFVPVDHRRARQRDNFRRAILAAGFDEELFWAKLRSVASRFIDTYAYPAPETAAESHRRNNDLCREAFLALNSARQVFGREQFDRLLYEAVAPITQISSATNAPDPASELRFVAGGCQ